MSSRTTETYTLSEDYVRKRKREEDEWSDLAAAIVLLAFKDLIDVLYKLIIYPPVNNPQRVRRKRELEKKKSEILLFFKSPWYDVLTAIDADWVIKEAQEQAMAKALKFQERQVIKEVACEQNENKMEGFY